MADQSKAHLWLNTFIACLALLASGTSALFAWKSYQLRGESVGFEIQPADTCSLQFEKRADDGVISLCWTLTIINQRDARISLVSYEVASNVEVTQEGIRYGYVFHEGGDNIQDHDEKPTAFPIVLDGGEAHSYLVRKSFSTPNSVLKAIESLSQGKPMQQLQFLDAKSAAKSSKIDLMGNSIEGPRVFRKTQTGLEFDPPQGYRTAKVIISFHSGRGNTFDITLSYPSYPGAI